MTQSRKNLRYSVVFAAATTLAGCHHDAGKSAPRAHSDSARSAEPPAPPPPPRGIRNNNPGNIRPGKDSDWDGLAPQKDDGEGYLVFATPLMGLRALARTLMTYQDHHN